MELSDREKRAIFYQVQDRMRKDITETRNEGLGSSIQSILRNDRLIDLFNSHVKSFRTTHSMNIEDLNKIMLLCIINSW